MSIFFLILCRGRSTGAVAATVTPRSQGKGKGRIATLFSVLSSSSFRWGQNVPFRSNIDVGKQWVILGNSSSYGLEAPVYEGISENKISHPELAI